MPIDHETLHSTLCQLIRQRSELPFAILALPRLRLRRHCPLGSGYGLNVSKPYIRVDSCLLLLLLL
jgi:hypothetical protein